MDLNDPAETEELCDKEHNLGWQFVDNLKHCADCIKKRGGLSERFFDQGDAQDALDLVNLCQSLYTSDHKEMISAMSVIMETGSVVGYISTQITPTSTTSANLTTTTQTSTSETTTEANSPSPTVSPKNQPVSESRAWVAGPVVGSVAGVSGIIGAAFLLIRRRRRQSDKSIAGKDGGPNQLHDKPELPAEEIHHRQSPVETTAKALPPQELHSAEIAELPADNGK